MLAKTRLNSRYVLTSEALINSNISNDKFISVNNVLKEYDEVKKSFNIFDLIKKLIK